MAKIFSYKAKIIACTANKIYGTASIIYGTVSKNCGTTNRIYGTASKISGTTNKIYGTAPRNNFILYFRIGYAYLSPAKKYNPQVGVKFVPTRHT